MKWSWVPLALAPVGVHPASFVQGGKNPPLHPPSSHNPHTTTWYPGDLATHNPNPEIVVAIARIVVAAMG